MESQSSVRVRWRPLLLLLALAIAGGAALAFDDSAGPATARAQVPGVLAPSLQALSKPGARRSDTDIMQQGDRRRAAWLRGSGVSDLLVVSVGLSPSASAVVDAFGVQDHTPRSDSSTAD